MQSIISEFENVSVRLWWELGNPLGQRWGKVLGLVLGLLFVSKVLSLLLALVAPKRTRDLIRCEYASLKDRLPHDLVLYIRSFLVL